MSATDRVLILHGGAPRNIEAVSAGRHLPVIKWHPDPAQPNYLTGCLGLTAEMFAISMMAGALRRSVAAGTITQGESAKILFEFRWRLERDPFPSRLFQ